MARKLDRNNLLTPFEVKQYLLQQKLQISGQLLFYLSAKLM